MKILSLNKTQRKKLMLLINQFFPELHSFQVDDHYGNYMVTLNTYADKKATCEGFYEEKIHWYQLCLTELPKRIFNKINFKDYKELQDFDDFLWNIGLDRHARTGINFQAHMIYVKHPVDFLYSFVQECKKNKYFKK